MEKVPFDFRPLFSFNCQELPPSLLHPLNSVIAANYFHDSNFNPVQQESETVPTVKGVRFV